MDNDTLVSVYCLAYNHEKYIRQTLVGFVNQEVNFKFEVYVHDDASSDNTAAIIREFEGKYPSIIHGIYQTENQYSKGVNISHDILGRFLKGKYIAVCEGDDYWCSKDKLQLQVDILENNPSYSACVHQTKCLNCKNNKKSYVAKFDSDRIIDLKTVIENAGCAYHTSSLLYRREYFFNQPDFLYTIKGVGDYPLSIYLALMGQIYYLNKALSVYRLFSCDTAWSSRTLKSTRENRVNHYNSGINMYIMADEFSKGKHHQIFEQAIVSEEYKIEKLNRHCNMKKNPRYRELYKAEPLFSKVQIYLKAILPEYAINIVKKVKYRRL